MNHVKAVVAQILCTLELLLILHGSRAWLRSSALPKWRCSGAVRIGRAKMASFASRHRGQESLAGLCLQLDVDLLELGDGLLVEILLGDLTRMVVVPILVHKVRLKLSKSLDSAFLGVLLASKTVATHPLPNFGCEISPLRLLRTAPSMMPGRGGSAEPTTFERNSSKPVTEFASLRVFPRSLFTFAFVRTPCVLVRVKLDLEVVKLLEVHSCDLERALLPIAV